MARILIVEDSRSQALNLQLMLEKAGYEVVLAIDGQAGFARLREAQFDVVLSDVNMPVMDGFELCRLVRQTQELSGVPIILMTTLREMQDMREGMDAGANMYVLKPIVADDLARRVARVLAGQPPTARPAPAARPAAASDSSPASPAHETPASSPGVSMPRPEPMAAVNGLLARIVATGQEALALSQPDDVAEKLRGIVSIAREGMQLCSGPPRATWAGSGALLLLEPSDSLRRALQGNLERCGYKVRAVSSEQGAVAVCQDYGTSVSALVVEARCCTDEVLRALRQGSPQARLLCLADRAEDAPPDVPTLIRPFTFQMLADRLSGT